MKTPDREHAGEVAREEKLEWTRETVCEQRCLLCEVICRTIALGTRCCRMHPLVEKTG